MRFKKLAFTHLSLKVFSALYDFYQNVYILESVQGPKKLTQYSFRGFSPKLTITAKNDEVITNNEKTGEKTIEKVYDLLGKSELLAASAASIHA